MNKKNVYLRVFKAWRVDDQVVNISLTPSLTNEIIIWINMTTKLCLLTLILHLLIII